jgi:DNA-binding transcriptional ArsR family regulator
MADPLRARTMGFLSEFTASPRQMATAFGEELGKVGYQVRTLLKHGLIELVDERPVRGAVEHFYRAVERPWVSAEELAKLRRPERNAFALHVNQLGFADAAAALSSEVFSSRPDNIFSRFPVVLDEEGWQKVSKLHDDLLEKIVEEKAASDGRRAKTGDEGIRAESFMLFFERESLTDWKNGS